MTLHQLLSERRQELLDRWSGAAQAVFANELSKVELVDRMPLFIGEIIAALGPDVMPIPDEGSANAEEHGVQRLRLGFDVGEVVREYGLLHSAILELADEAGMPICAAEARLLAKCISKGTCDAVRQYQWQRDSELQRQAAEHLGFIAHELRNQLASARMAHGIMRRRQREHTKVSETLERALTHLSEMIDNALSHAWLKVGAPVHGERVELRRFLADIEATLSEEAALKKVKIVIDAEPIEMEADPRLLGSALSNLVRNALKFTKRDTTVVIRARRQNTRVLIEVEDGCGGLPPGKSEELFSPFVQKGADRSGFGLGLAIARQAAESHNGTIKVRNLPGVGCVFTIDLPLS